MNNTIIKTPTGFNVLPTYNPDEKIPKDWTPPIYTGYPDEDPAECLVKCESCEEEINIEITSEDDAGNYFCPQCYEVLAPVMKAEYLETLKQDQKTPRTSQDAPGPTNAEDRDNVTPKAIKGVKPRENRGPNSKNFNEESWDDVNFGA